METVESGDSGECGGQWRAWETVESVGDSGERGRQWRVWESHPSSESTAVSDHTRVWTGASETELLYPASIVIGMLISIA